MDLGGQRAGEPDSEVVDLRGLAIELNPCAGGMAEGFKRAGVRFDVAVDWDPNACESYERNLGHRPEQMDIRDLLLDVRAAGDAAPMFFGRPVSLFVADPPCTPWSRAGKRLGVNDERDMLGVTCELIRLLRPAAYLIGNVPGLDDSTQWHHVQRALAPLRAIGYCIADYASLDAADFGVPQHRVRPFWYGHLAGPCIRWPLPTHGEPEAQRHALPGLALKPWMTCRQALEHLPLELLGRPVHLKRNAPDFHPASEPNRPAKVVPSSMPGNGGGVMVDRTWEDRHPPSAPSAPSRTIRVDGGRAGRREAVLEIPTLFRANDDGHPCATPDAPAPTVRGGGEGHTAPQIVLANSRHPPELLLEIPAIKRKPDPNHPADSLDAPSRAVTTQAGCTNLLEWPWDRPSTVVDSRPELAPFGRDGRGRNGDVEHQRSHPNAVVLSERAGAILQGFTEDWYFAGATKKARWSQIGQAMPPGLAEPVARAVVRQLLATFRAAERAEASAHG